MIETIFLLSGLVIDTFIMTSVNGLSLNENLRTYLGIETLFSIIGFLIGFVILRFIPSYTFKFICGIIIIVIQLVDWYGFDFPERVNAMLLGSDSLIVFANLNWIYIPVMAVLEFCAITLGSILGFKLKDYIPEFFQEHAGHFVMFIIGFGMILPVLLQMF